MAASQLSNLPPEIWKTMIFPGLDGAHRGLARSVCRAWHDLIQVDDPALLMRDAELAYARSGELACLRWAIRNGCRMVRNAALCEEAAAGGHLHVLKWLMDSVGCPCGEAAFSRASLGGHLDVLKYLKDEAHAPFARTLTCALAAGNGHLETVKWLHANGFPLEVQTLGHAASGGHMRVMEWLLENRCPWDETVCAMAAKVADREALEWLRGKGCPWDEATTSAAALEGHDDLLRWLVESGCPTDEWPCRKAAERGNIELLQWLHDHESPWESGACALAARKGRLEVVRFLHEHGCPWDTESVLNASHGGFLPILHYLKDNECPWSDEACTLAADGGQLETLQWLNSIGGSLNATTVFTAAGRGHINILEWLRDRGLPLTQFDEICNAPALEGQLAALEWLLANGCSINMKAAPMAAERGQLASLQWLRAKGPWDDGVAHRCFSKAAGAGHLPVLQWLKSACGCRGNIKAITKALKSSLSNPRKGRPEVIRWLLGNDCPITDALKHSAASFFALIGDLDSLEQMHKDGYELSQELVALAGRTGDMQIMKWLEEKGLCNFGDFEYVVLEAACNGRMHILKWLKKKECHIDKVEATYGAARGGHIEILQWLKENYNITEWPEVIATAAAAGGHLSTLKWLHENGCSMGLWTYSQADEAGQYHITDWLASNGSREESCDARAFTTWRWQTHL